MDNQEGAITFRDWIAYLASIGWVRIVVFCFGTYILFESVFGFLSYNELVTENSDLASFLDDSLMRLLLWIVPSLVIALTLEYFRCGGNIATLGFSFNRFAIREIIIGIGVSIAASTFIYFLAIIAGANVSRANFEVKQISEYIVFIIFFLIGFFGIIFRGIEELFDGFITLFISSVILSVFYYIADYYVVEEKVGVMSFLNTVLGFVNLSMMYLLTRSLWMLASFACVDIITSEIFVWNYDNTFNINPYFRWFVFGEQGYEDGLCVTVMLVIIIAILPKITKVSPYTAAALFKQQYAESELKALYKFRI